MADIVSGRSCDGCAMCCYLPRIDALEKPAGTWCPHCPTRKGCAIHGAHPDDCRDFNCGWLTTPSLGPEWKPSKARIILMAELDGARLTAMVDPKRPNAWRQKPYYDQIKGWARAAVEHNGQVVVRLGERYWVILPDEDVDLGTVGPDEAIITEIKQTPNGKVLKAMKLPRTDPRARAASGDE